MDKNNNQSSANQPLNTGQTQGLEGSADIASLQNEINNLANELSSKGLQNKTVNNPLPNNPSQQQTSSPISAASPLNTVNNQNTTSNNSLPQNSNKPITPQIPTPNFSPPPLQTSSMANSFETAEAMPPQNPTTGLTSPPPPSVVPPTSGGDEEHKGKGKKTILYLLLIFIMLSTIIALALIILNYSKNGEAPVSETPNLDNAQISIPAPSITAVVESDDAETKALSEQGTTDEVNDIETDLNNTDLTNIDKETTTIDSELP